MHLAWIDLETTGTDKLKDSIMEIGFILTDPNLYVIEEYESLVKPTTSILRDTMLFHAKSGLLRAFAEAEKSEKGIPSVNDIDYALTAILDKYAIKQVRLAGSGVAHFDMHFIQRQLFHFSQRLHYAPLDTGCIRRFLTDVCGYDIPDNKDILKHRALDDIWMHLNEAIMMRNVLKTKFTANLWNSLWQTQTP